MTIRINESAKTAYIEMCANVDGWKKTAIASEALILGLEVMRKMDEYHNVVKVEAQKEVLNQLIEEEKKDN